MKKHRNQFESFMIKRALHKYAKKITWSRSASKNPNSDRIYEINQEEHKCRRKQGRGCDSFRHGPCLRNGIRRER
jgi:hypothetical protein